MTAKNEISKRTRCAEDQDADSGNVDSGEIRMPLCNLRSFHGIRWCAGTQGNTGQKQNQQYWSIERESECSMALPLAS